MLSDPAWNSCDRTGLVKSGSKQLCLGSLELWNCTRTIYCVKSVACHCLDRPLDMPTDIGLKLDLRIRQIVSTVQPHWNLFTTWPACRDWLQTPSPWCSMFNCSEKICTAWLVKNSFFIWSNQKSFKKNHVENQKDFQNMFNFYDSLYGLWVRSLYWYSLWGHLPWKKLLNKKLLAKSSS